MEKTAISVVSKVVLHTNHCSGVVLRHFIENVMMHFAIHTSCLACQSTANSAQSTSRTFSWSIPENTAPPLQRIVTLNRLFPFGSIYKHLSEQLWAWTMRTPTHVWMGLLHIKMPCSDALLEFGALHEIEKQRETGPVDEKIALEEFPFMATF